MTLDGTFEGQTATILKDDGCNTKVVSYDFVRRYPDRIKTSPDNIEISHSRNNSKESSHGKVINATVKIGSLVIGQTGLLRVVTMMFYLVWLGIASSTRGLIKKSVQ